MRHSLTSRRARWARAALLARPGGRGPVLWGGGYRTRPTSGTFGSSMLDWSMATAPPGSCTRCAERMAAPLAFDLPVDVQWQWSEVRWGHDKRSSLDFERETGAAKHAFYMGVEKPACAPWWDQEIAPLRL